MSYRSLRAPALAISTLIAAGAVALAESPAAGAAVSCDRVAAPSGSDSAAGTEASPLRTAQRLVESLAPGQTGCLRAGTFSAEQTKVKTPNVTLTSYPGEQATLRGQLRFQATADGAVVEGLTLDGRNRRNLLGPLVYADGVVLRDNDISNGHTAICVHVDSYPNYPAPRGVVIEDNRIHDCGKLPATNHHHGIYLGDAQGTVVRGNVIYDNADRGIQLYPDADGTTVTGNVIDGNGQGIIFGSDDDDSPDQNLVQGNVITNSKIRYNVESHSQGAPYGQGNVVRRNCIHGGVRDDGNGGIQSPQKGFTATDNVIADPRYVDRGAKNFELRSDSPCLSILGGSGAVAVPAETDPDPDAGQEALTLEASKRAARRGGHVRLRGEALVESPTVRILRRAGGRWRYVDRIRLGEARYTTRARINRRRVNRFKALAEGGVASDVVKVRARSRR